MLNIYKGNRVWDVIFYKLTTSGFDSWGLGQTHELLTPSLYNYSYINMYINTLHAIISYINIHTHIHVLLLRVTCLLWTLISLQLTRNTAWNTCSAPTTRVVTCDTAGTRTSCVIAVSLLSLDIEAGQRLGVSLCLLNPSRAHDSALPPPPQKKADVTWDLWPLAPAPPQCTSTEYTHIHCTCVGGNDLLTLLSH